MEGKTIIIYSPTGRLERVSTNSNLIGSIYAINIDAEFRMFTPIFNCSGTWWPPGGETGPTQPGMLCYIVGVIVVVIFSTIIYLENSHTALDLLGVEG